MASKKTVDFTNVKDGGGQFSKKHMPAGDYLAKVTKVQDAKSKSDGEFMWLFTIQLKDTPSATYPYYIKLAENQLWKLRNLLVAAGINVPKKKVGVDPSKVIGKTIAVSLEDEEYKEKMQSVVQATFPAADLEDTASDDDDEETEEEEEETTSDDTEEEEEAPAPKKKKDKGKKKAPAADDEELEELEIEEI
jgi:hypothetical protein